MIELHITMTAKGYSPKAKWTMFDDECKRFDDMSEARKYLAQRYGKSKRVPMYRDTKDGKTIKSGYVYSFRNSDISHVPVDKWIQQDWVSFNECKPIAA